MRFRKKPVVVEAWQFNGEPRWRWPDWLRSHPDTAHRLDWSGAGTSTHLEAARTWMSITTLEGQMRADVGDWIIRGVEGEVYPCKPSVFEATYEPAESSRG